MKDMFDRIIRTGDYITYNVRSSCTVTTNIAHVTSVEEFTLKARVIAGNDYRWHYGTGRSTLNAALNHYVYTHVPYEGRDVTLRVSGNVLVVNGIDALGIRDGVMDRQRETILQLNVPSTG